MGEAPRLKAMTSTEILDAAFRLYRNNFGTYLGIFAVIYVPITLVVLAVSGPLLSQAQALILSADTQHARMEATKHFLFTQFFIAISESVINLLIAVPLATGALTCAVGMSYLNEKATIGKSYRQIFPLFFKYLGTTLLVGLVTGLGSMMCFVPGFIFMTWFFASPSIVCLEGRGGTAAMGRSRELVSGFGWRIFWFLILNFLLQGFLMAPIAVASEFVLPWITESAALQFTISTVLHQILGILAAPFFSAVVVLLYYDLRIRKEAFDLEILAKNLGAAAPAKAEPAQP